MNSSTIINLSSGSSGESGEVLLEQKPWDDSSNKVTKIDIINAMSDSFYGTEEFSLSCQIANDTYQSVLYAYPTPANLSFDLDITYGNLGAGVAGNHTVTEIISFTLGLQESTSYPVDTFTSAEWLTDVYDEQGNVTSTPSISVSGDTITISKPVYGSVGITYETFRYAYGLSIEAREDSEENYYQSVAWARWDGGVTLLELQPPEDANEQYKNNNTCRGGSLSEVTGPDDTPRPPRASGKDKDVYVDYCTQLVKSRGY